MSPLPLAVVELLPFCCTPLSLWQVFQQDTREHVSRTELPPIWLLSASQAFGNGILCYAKPD